MHNQRLEKWNGTVEGRARPLQKQYTSFYTSRSCLRRPECEAFECLHRYRVRARHATLVLQENDSVPIYIGSFLAFNRLVPTMVRRTFRHSQAPPS